MNNQLPQVSDFTKALALLLLANLALPGCTVVGQQPAAGNLLNAPASTSSMFVAVSDRASPVKPVPDSFAKEATNGATNEVAKQAVQIVELPERTSLEGVSPTANQRGMAGLSSENSDKFAVLAYHRVGDDDSKYTVTAQMFDEHMRYLYANNYRTVTTGDLLNYFAGSVIPDNSVLITIDDGHRSSFDSVHNILQQYGFNALYFPYSDYIDNGGLTTAMMKDMLATGRVEFGLHTKTHAALTEQGESETYDDYHARVLYELNEPAGRLGHITGTTLTSIAYPYGKVNRQVEKWVYSQGVELGFTVNCALNDRTTNPLRLNRCTIQKTDDVDMFATKLAEPRVALARLERKEADVTKNRSLPPEFLGHLSDREFFKGIPIEPFAAYFVDPEGERLRYDAPGLPEGLHIDNKTGEISGTPAQSVRLAKITVQAVDETGSVAKSNRFNMVVY